MGETLRFNYALSAQLRTHPGRAQTQDSRYKGRVEADNNRQNNTLSTINNSIHILTSLPPKNQPKPTKIKMAPKTIQR